MFKIITLDQLLKMLDEYEHKELHIHHTWRPDHAIYYNTKAVNDDERALNRQQAFKDFHIKTNGWNDIAQHVTLLPDGRFVTGRDFSKNPASITGHNSKAFMMEMIGDFDIGKDKLEGKQKASAMGLARYFNKKGRYIRFHRENSPKTCPRTGIDKFKFIEEVMELPVKSPRILSTVRKGSKGADVKTLQENLNKQDYNLVADGIFGAKTETVVIDFQRKNKLTPDGIVGPKTWAALEV